MKQVVTKFLNKYGTDPIKIDRLLITSFITINKLKVSRNQLLQKYLINETDIEYGFLKAFNNLITKSENPAFSFEELIKLFEFVVSPADKIVNGAVYTPKNIRTYIINSVFKKYKQNKGDFKLIKIADISCGCGGFLFDVARELKKITSKTYAQIFNDNIFGLDIQIYSIDRTKLLLNLLAVSVNEDEPELKFNLHHGNALNFNWATKEKKLKNKLFDVIIGNPPYVGAPNIDAVSMELLKAWSVTKSGKADLYIPFFEIALSSLVPKGILGYITVNTFFKSVNGRALREYFENNSFSLEIIDFSGEKVFKKNSTYTCICIMENRSCQSIKYLKTESKNLSTIKQAHFHKIKYNALNNADGWLLGSETVTHNINKIENCGVPLGDANTIRNGFATLRNEIYLFSPIRENSRYYYFQKKGIEYKDEKTICVDAIKPNILKTEDDIATNMEKLIFPYIIHYDPEITQSQRIEVIKESVIKTNFPYAYEYLLYNKNELKKRDKEKRIYSSWYAFGRNQALDVLGYKLLFPYMSDAPNFVFTEEIDLLFYNGYAIISDDPEDLLILKKILQSSVFWYYVYHTSKPYGSGFYSLEKHYIKKFGVCELNETEKDWLRNESNMTEINNFIEMKYGIVL